MKSTIAAEKEALRKTVREFYYRTDTGKAQRDQELRNAFLALPELEAADTVLLFRGVGHEPDTAPLLGALAQHGKKAALPRCLPGGRMEAVQYMGPELMISGAYGIPEPAQSCPVISRDALDLILVPNLLCDRRGYRLGHGGGYYDRYLAGLEPHCLTVGLCPDALLRDSIPADQFDIRVRLVLTETKRLDCSTARSGAY